MADHTKPLAQSDLLFSSASTNITSVARQLSHSTSTHSLSARLKSIDQDAYYVHRIKTYLDLPVVPNERCGSWYVRPGIKAGSAYFKSTDGHAGEWYFSLRRLNLQLLPVINQAGGCIIVDSTRRGKLMPDALAKTVPIWCAVMNRLLYPESISTHELVVHPKLVSPSEAAQIEARLDGFVESAKELQLDIYALRQLLNKPLTPYWVSNRLEDPPDRESMSIESYPVFLCMASSYQPSSIIESETGYVQGAGDDNEGWSRGLTSVVFWKHQYKLSNTPEGDLPSLIDFLVSRAKAESKDADISQPLLPYTKIRVGNMTSDFSLLEAGTRVIICASEGVLIAASTAEKCLLHLNCRQGKLGARDLRSELRKVPPFLADLGPNEDVLILCATGEDLSIGVALTIICMYGNETGICESDGCNGAASASCNDGELSCEHINVNLHSKVLIKQRLAAIMAAMPSASPSRATLTAVNSFLLKAPQLRS